MGTAHSADISPGHMISFIEMKKHSFPLVLKSVLLVSQLNFVRSSRLVTENQSCPGKTGMNGSLNLVCFLVSCAY